MASYDFSGLVRTAAQALSDRQEEVNRLNVFPVPDGDTGTNMSMTVNTVVSEVDALGAAPSLDEFKAAVVHGSLMGARGNSGVITSQILRGLCDGIEEGDGFDSATIAKAFDRAVVVAFQAVRKPVEGTILTVLRDTAEGARQAADDQMGLEDTLRYISDVAYASVRRTPELLPVLKENGVVDAGGFGLAILLDAFTRAVTGDLETKAMEGTIDGNALPKVEIEGINDWEGSEYTYCNEFLVDSQELVIEDALDFLSTMGDCELCVGATPKFKVHVHSNTPDKVLAYFLERGQVFEVHIHNMRLQSEERLEKIEQDAQASQEPEKDFGFVAVAAGSGMAATLQALGVDKVVSGGQTMNPSTKDILDAVESINARSVVVFPNNKNIILAANQAAQLCEDRQVAVVPTTSVPQSFSALIAFDESASLEENVEAFEEAISCVRYGEITHAIKRAKAADGSTIHKGDVIGIVEDSIDLVGKDVMQVAFDLVPLVVGDEAETLTILAGEDFPDEDLDALVERIEEAFPDLEVDPQRGGQPLYPVVMAAE